MKIAMVASSVSRAAGGIYEVERRLSLELSQALEHDVAVFAGSDAYSDADSASWSPLVPNVYPICGFGAFGYAPGMAAGLSQCEADIAHLHMLWMYPSIVVSRWARETGKPYLITLHGMLDAWAIANSSWKKKLALIFYEKKNLHQASCIHVLSEAEAKSARAFGLKNPLAVIPNGIDLPEGIVEVSKNETRQRRLLFLGRLHPKKGLLNLIQAWQELCHSGLVEDWVLIIAGWAEVGHDEELKQRAGELGFSFVNSSYPGEVSGAQLQFLGPQFGDAKAQCLNDCDAFVLPSFSEGLPMSILEAWAYGKPVIMTPMCNLPEGVIANAAIMANPSILSLKEGLAKLIRMTDSERGAMGKRGRQLVESSFTWESVGSRMEQVYQWLVHGGDAPACVLV